MDKKEKKIRNKLNGLTSNAWYYEEFRQYVWEALQRLHPCSPGSKKTSMKYIFFLILWS